MDTKDQEITPQTLSWENIHEIKIIDDCNFFLLSVISYRQISRKLPLL